MYKFLIITTFLLTIIGCQGQSANAEGSNFQTVSKEVFAQEMKSENALLVDVRTPEEFQLGTIDNAINVDFYAENFQDQLKALPKDKKIMVFCRSGGRSGKTVEMMKSLGFTDVYELEGGYSQW